MAEQAAAMRKTRTRYSSDYMAEALTFSDRVGISAATRELGLQASQLYQRRSKAQQNKGSSQISGKRSGP